MARPHIKMKTHAAKGEVLEIKTLLRHRMETGLRTDGEGNVIPRHIINRFVCRMGDAEVFSMDLHPAVSANPFIRFHVVARESGSFQFLWYEDGGAVTTAERKLDVT